MAIPIYNIAILDETGNVKFERLVEVANAIQIQMQTQIAKEWLVSANVKAFRTPAEIPNDYWTCSVVNEISEGVGLNGIHWYRTDSNGNRKPYSKARYTNYIYNYFFENHLTKVISEEIIETCIDPFGENKVAGNDPDPNSQSGQSVEFLVEIGDPVQGLDNGYYIGNVFVTNWIFPSYFEATATAGKKYDYLGQFTETKQLSEGGYQIFQRAGEWWQAWKIKGQKYFVKQGEAVQETANTDTSIPRGVIIAVIGTLIFVFIGTVWYLIRKIKSK